MFLGLSLLFKTMDGRLNNLSVHELTQKFVKKYQDYLENNCLFTIIDEIMMSQPESGQMLDGLKENFLKASYVLQSGGSSCDEQLQQQMADKSTIVESKAHLLDRIELWLDAEMDNLNECLSLTAELHRIDAANVINKLVEVSARLEASVDKHKMENQRRLNYWLNEMVEVVRLLKCLFDECKLQFYAQKINTDCEFELASCRLLLTKIENEMGQLKVDVYADDKVKALGVIDQHLDMELRKSKEKMEKTADRLSLFKSIECDLKPILDVYVKLKADLDKKYWELNRLKENIAY